MSRLLAITALGLTLCALEPLRVATVHAAGQNGPRAAAASPQAPADPPALDRALLAQLCSPWHTDKRKTGGSALPRVDVTGLRGNAEVLERVVRKLRTGQMPPMGRPRPDEIAIDTFAGSMEAALDRAAAQPPNA